MNSTCPLPRGFCCWLRICAASLIPLAPIAAQTPPVESGAASVTSSVAPTAAASPEATAAPTTTPSERGRVLYPAPAPQPTPGSPRANDGTTGMPGLATSFVMLLALCGGAYYLVRRQTGFAPAGKGQRRLLVSESRSLGNRQFLVVVEYESERILLGVTPGKIDYLCPLPGATVPSGLIAKERVP